MKDERWVLVVLVCLFIVLAILYTGTFATAKVEIIRNKNLNIEKQQLQSQMQQQNNAINTFVSQLQECKTIEDIDNVLATINVERVK